MVHHGPKKAGSKTPPTGGSALKPPTPAGLRYNSGKLRVDLIPASFVVALAQVFSQGARKYENDNWKKGLSLRDTLGCCERHLIRLKQGEQFDPETGCHHGAMVAWNALVAMWMMLTGKGTHDLPTEGEELPSMIRPTHGRIKEMDDAGGAPTYYPPALV